MSDKHMGSQDIKPKKEVYLLNNDIKIQYTSSPQVLLASTLHKTWNLRQTLSAWENC